jgi:hypothetical protein
MDKHKIIASIIVPAILILLSSHFLAERIAQQSFPTGDEGSWMAVAAQLASGNGFTTRWLEHPFLAPYALPRPDDYRYPGLSLALAASFKLFGASYRVALWCIAAIFLLFVILYYFAMWRQWGLTTAILASLLLVFSLLQLHWNSKVYTEGLFGVGLCFLVFAHTRFALRDARYWIASGAIIGLLYLVRPNAALFIIGPLMYLFARRKQDAVPVPAVVYGLIAFIIVIAPWLVRNWVLFGNPVHIAGSAGFLRVENTEPLTWSLIDFLKRYGIFYPAKATFFGGLNFFAWLDFFEHRMEVVPLVCALAGFFLRRPFYRPLFAAGFAATAVFCWYASCGSWSGIRYFSSFLPFVYAYGISVLFSIINRLPISRQWVRSTVLPACVAALLLAPVVYPHRYYERTLKKPAADVSFADHQRILGSLLEPGQAYLADQAAQINFMTAYNCVGMQAFFDSTQVNRAVETFKPKALVLLRGEEQSDRMRGVLRQMHRICRVDSVSSTGGATYYRIQPIGMATP